MSARTEKRCLYDVLGISKESTPDEIRSSYRRLALLRHPDKLIKSGNITESEATSQFQELVHAYEVLSDPKERAWYDSHRSQILFADHATSSSSRAMPGGGIPDLFAFFSPTVYSGYSDTGKGFYKVYYDVFNSVYLNEVNFVRTLGLRVDSVKEAPIMGNLESPYAQATAFYNYWLGFSTVMDFCWVDEWDAAGGANRRVRRKMEEVNKKIRKKAKREFNETVRSLAEFVKKRDKRVMDMVVKRNAEMEKKRVEEMERKRRLEKERLEKVMSYEEPDWAKVEDEEEEEEVEEDEERRKDDQLYCIVCSKKFKSEKQWKNHEQSKKHKEKVAELREHFLEEDKETVSEEGNETVDEELHEKVLEGLSIDDDEEEDEEEEADETDEEADEDLKGSGESESEGEDEDEDDEMSLLKKMVSGQKKKQKNVVLREEEEEEAQVEIESSDTAEFGEFDIHKRTGRNKKERNKRNVVKDTTDDASKVQMPQDDGNTDENVDATDSDSGAFEDSQKDEPDDVMEYDNRKATGRRRRAKKDKDKTNLGGLTEKSSEADYTQVKNGDKEAQTEAVKDRSEYIDFALERKKAARSKKSTRGMKAKGTSKKNSSNECDKCGEDFESRSKLHKHLADSGHATVKSK